MPQTLKIVLLGVSGVGKTNLVSWYLKNTPTTVNDPTIGVVFSSKDIMVADKKYSIHIWDTAGQERYNSIVNLYYRNTNGCICVFDVGNYDSFLKISHFLDKYRQFNDNKCIMLVANKCDIDQNRWKITKKEINDYAKENSFMLVYTSCLTGDNVNKVFDQLINCLTDCPKIFTPNSSNTPKSISTKKIYHEPIRVTSKNQPYQYDQASSYQNINKIDTDENLDSGTASKCFC